MAGRRLLFIVHDASRSGAPILALTFLKWLLAHSPLAVDVLLLNDGPLRAEFARLATTLVARELGGGTSMVSRARVRVLGSAADHWIDSACRRLRDTGYDIVYGHSIVCLPWLERLKGGGRRVCAVHELTWAIESFFERADVSRGLAGLDRIAAGSTAVAANLIARYAVPPDRVSVCHSFIDAPAADSQRRPALRAEHGIEPGTLLVGGMGKPEMRKGTDLLPAIARAVQRLDPALAFQLLWVGGDARDPMVRMLRRDAEQLGVQRHLAFVGATPRPDDYLDLFDAFMLPSREDPFPLVALSAAWLGKPILAFDGSGGMPELLAGGAGCLVPYLDTDKFAAQIVRLAREPAAAAAMGRTVHAVVTSQYTVDAKAPLLLRLITGDSE